MIIELSSSIERSSGQVSSLAAKLRLLEDLHWKRFLKVPVLYRRFQNSSVFLWKAANEKQ